MVGPPGRMSAAVSPKGPWSIVAKADLPAAGKVAQAEALPRRERRPTLSPSLFREKVREAYQVARDQPALLDQFRCYCYCEKNFGHKSLLACYVDDHAAGCGLCMQEAFDAARMRKQGKSIKEIRAFIDREYR